VSKTTVSAQVLQEICERNAQRDDVSLKQSFMAPTWLSASTAGKQTPEKLSFLRSNGRCVGQQAMITVWDRVETPRFPIYIATGVISSYEIC